jgi:hypothetical protein
MREGRFLTGDGLQTPTHNPAPLSPSGSDHSFVKKVYEKHPELLE